MDSFTVRKHLAGLPSLAAMLAGVLMTACLGPESSATSGDAEGGLSASGEKCDSLAADVKLTGGGYVRTPDSYGARAAGQCPSAYLLDLTDYDSAFLLGANLAYAGPKPGTEAACNAATIRAEVWQVNADKTTKYLKGLVKSGRWITNFWGEKECSIPVASLEESIPGFKAGEGRDYRIAFRAEGTGRSTATAVFHTQDAHLPSADEWSKRLDQLVSAAQQFNANANQIYGTRSGELIQRVCRNARLDLVTKEINAPSLVKAGASTEAVQQNRTAYQNAYNVLCASGAPPASLTAESHLEKQLDEIYRTQSLIRDQIASTLGVTKPEALTAMGQALVADLERVMSRCNASQGKILDFLHNGALPAGTTPERLLLGSCEGSATNAGGQVGIGVDLRGMSRDTARRNFAACMDALNDSLHTQVGCGGPDGPISSGDGSEGGTENNEPEKDTECTREPNKLVCDEFTEVCETDSNGTRTCSTSLTTTTVECKPGPEPRNCTQTTDQSGQTCRTTGATTECDEVRIVSGTPREVEGVIGQIQDAAVNATVFGMFFVETAVPSLILLNEITDQLSTLAVGMAATGGAIGAAGVAVPITAPVALPAAASLEVSAALTGGLGTVLSVYNTVMPSELRDSVNAWAHEYIEDKRRQHCQVAPRAPMCQNNELCPAIDAAGRPGFYTRPAGFDGVQPLDNEDRINHCLCALTDNAYNVGDFAAASKMCPSKEERQKQDCLTNPFGDDDRPKRECIQYLYPTNIDMNAWYARLCQKIKPNCNNDYITLDGACGCGTTPLPAGEIALQCPNRDVTDCGPDSTLDLKTCSCQSFGSGDAVWGTQPECPLLPETFPGGTDTWQSTEPVWSDIVTLGNAKRTLLRVDPGATTVVAPAIRMNDFQRDIGSDLKVTMLAPDSLLSSAFPGETNLHLTIPELQLFNEPVGQIAHRNLTANQLTTVSVPLSARHRTALQAARKGGAEVRLSMFANTAQTNQALAIAGIEPSGALSAAAQRQQCRARPDLIPPVLGPDFQIPGDITLPDDWDQVLLDRVFEIR